MRGLLVISLMTFLGSSLIAQEWQTDFEQAKAKAAEQNQNIILVFQGSDWCAPCIKLEKRIWSSNEFIAYANEHFVMLKADFPKKKRNRLDVSQQNKNKKLIEKYHKQGFFPFIVILDKKGNVLGKTGYSKMGPSGYIKLLSSF